MNMDDYYNGTGDGGGGFCGLLLAMLLGGLVCALLGSCRTKYVSVPEYHREYVHRTDTLLRTDTVREKEWMTVREVDSAQMAELGLQLRGLKNAYLIERNRNRERSSDRHTVRADTIIKADSVRVPYPVVTNRVSLKDKIYYAAMGIAALVFIVLLYRLVIWLRARSLI